MRLLKVMARAVGIMLLILVVAWVAIQVTPEWETPIQVLAALLMVASGVILLMDDRWPAQS